MTPLSSSHQSKVVSFNDVTTSNAAMLSPPMSASSADMKTKNLKLLYSQAIDHAKAAGSTTVPLPMSPALPLNVPSMSPNHFHPFMMFPPVTSSPSMSFPQPPSVQTLSTQPLMPGMIQNPISYSPTPSSCVTSQSLLSPYSTSAPDFMFLLRKILADENNAIISWSKGFVCIHDPQGLATKILPKYFRHSNFSSFQRQLNYFGFRKVSGKGKMVPCSYYNENTTADLNSLLQVKKKPKNPGRRRMNHNRPSPKKDALKSNISSNQTLSSVTQDQTSDRMEIPVNATRESPSKNTSPATNCVNEIIPLTNSNISSSQFQSTKEEPVSKTSENKLVAITNYQIKPNGTNFSSNFNTPAPCATMLNNNTTNNNMMQQQNTFTNVVPDLNSLISSMGVDNPTNMSQQQCYNLNTFDPSMLPVPVEQPQNLSINQQLVPNNPNISFCTNNNDMSSTTNDMPSPFPMNDCNASSNSMNRSYSLSDLAMIPTLQDHQSSALPFVNNKPNTSKNDDANCYFADDDDFPQCEPVTVNDIIKVIIG